MNWIIYLIIGVLVAFMIAMLMLVYKTQKDLDAPLGGHLVVDLQEGKPLVYFEAEQSPEKFTDGQIVKLRVRVIRSQQKQSL